MAKAPRYSTGFRNALLNKTGTTPLDQFDSGTLEICADPRPASANDPRTGTVLASVPLTADAFAAAASGGALAKSANTWEALSALAAGTATWFRMKTSGDTNVTSTTEERIDGTCGLTDSDLILTAVTFASGDKVVIDTFNVNVVAAPV